MGKCYLCGKETSLKADSEKYVCDNCANTYIQKYYKNKLKETKRMNKGAPYGDDADHGEAVVGYMFVAFVTFVIGFLACLVVCGGK